MSGTEKQDRAISLDEIRERAKGTLVDIPDWNNDGQVKVRLKRIDMLFALAGTGILPNELRAVAMGAFERKDGATDIWTSPRREGEDQIGKFTKLLDAVCREAMVEPKFDEVQEIYPLTLPQKMAIFNWVMQEVRSLKPFRGESGINVGIMSNG